MNPVVQLSHVSVRLRGRTLIDDFSAACDAGDCVALIGGNGAGKTTLLRAIMGFVPCFEGEIKLSGMDAAARPGAKLRKRIAYVPQAPVLDFKMPVSVRDVVLMGRYADRGICMRLTDKDRDIAAKAMADAGIAHLADRPIGHLSGGERQKAQIARAMCQAPELVLLDEPTSNLDLAAQHECLDLVCDIHKTRNLTTIIVMHDLQALPPSCNRAIIIDDGRKVFDGRVGDVFTRENLLLIYKHRATRVIDKLVAAAPRGDGRP